MGTFVVAAFVLCVLVLAPLLLAARRREGAVPPRTTGALALATTAAALGLYLLLGSPAALDPVNVETPDTLEEAIVQLERRLAEEPSSVEGWVLLGRSRMAQEDFAKASAAFAKAAALLPDDPDLAVEYADAQMRASGDGQFPDDATARLERVVAEFPEHQRALFYLGAQRYQAGRPAEAAALWERLLPLVEPSTAAVLRPQLDDARAAAGLPPLPAAPGAGTPDDGPALAVTITVAPELAAALPPGATLFVFARPVDGAGPPVAAERVAAATFPAEVTLSDADSLMPTAKLSQLDRVEVVARRSASGDAAAATGDLESAPQVIAVEAGAKIALTLDRIHE